VFAQVAFIHYDCSREEGTYKQRWERYRKFFLDTLARPVPYTDPVQQCVTT